MTTIESQTGASEEQWWRIIKHLMENGHEDIAIHAEIIRQDFIKNPDPGIKQNINATMLKTLVQLVERFPDLCQMGEKFHFGYYKPGRISCVWTFSKNNQILTYINRQGEIDETWIENGEDERFMPVKNPTIAGIVSALGKEAKMNAETKEARNKIEKKIRGQTNEVKGMIQTYVQRLEAPSGQHSGIHKPDKEMGD